MLVASLVLDIPTQGLDTLYSYRVPDELSDAQVGCCAVVPFAHRKAIGFIAALQRIPEDAQEVNGIAVERLLAIEELVGGPYFDENGAACALYLSESCVAPLSTCFRLFTPPGGVPRISRGDADWQVHQPEIGRVDDRFVALTEEGRSYQAPANATRQRAILEALQAGELRVAELNLEYGSVASTLSSLQGKGVVRIEHRRRFRGSLDEAGAPAQAASRLALTPQQQEALAAIEGACAQGNGQVVLVDGVTGSGKTEVYLQAIEPLVAQGRSAIVLVPEIALTPQTVARFRGRFGDKVAVMHSRMSHGERYDQWDFIRSGAAQVVVGARSALFTPVRDLGIVIIDEEHEGSYKQDQAPRYHARTVAEWMAKRHGATLVLGSATPSIEALHACETEAHWTRIELAERVNKRPLPPVTVVDMAREFRQGGRSMFSTPLAKALEDTLEQQQKAILLLNQRGFSKFVLCRDCGFVPECPHCATSLTYHEFEGLLICHHCGFVQAIVANCPQCQSPYLKKFGAGTQRVEAELRALLATFGREEVPLIRMDADTTRTKGAHRKLLESFMAPGAAVLLGTQMIAKGLDFDDVTLVGVINADTMLKLPDFRSGERTYDLIEQVAGRAGRAKLPGRVFVQTYWSDSPAIQAAARHARSLFLDDELLKRRLLGYPPFMRMANALIWGKDAQRVQSEANRLYHELSAQVREAGEDDWIVLPATPCALSKLRDTYRWHVLIKAPWKSDMASVLLPYFRSRAPIPSIPVALDIDPLSLV